MITWHAHPTVAAMAVWKDYTAEVWGGDETGWAVYRIGGVMPVTAGTADGIEQAKTAAEAAMRAQYPPEP